MTSPQTPPTGPPSPPATTTPPSPQTTPETSAQATTGEQPAPPPPVPVDPEPGSRLDGLVAEWARLKPQLDELAERVKTLGDSIKTLTIEQCPRGTTNAVLRSPHLPTPYQVHRVEGWRVDTKAMKRESPETYVQWATRSTSWRMDAIT